MWSNISSQKVGLAGDLSTKTLPVDGRKIMEVLLNINAAREEKEQAADQLKAALDSLVLDLEF